MPEEIDFDAVFDPAPPSDPPLEPEAVEGGLPALYQIKALDLAPFAQSLVQYQKQVALMVKEAQALRITDTASQARATELGNLGRKTIKLVEAIKESPAYVEADKLVKDVRNLCKTLTDPLKNQVVEVVRVELLAYDDRVRLEQQRRDAAAREEARQLQAKLDAEAKVLREAAEAKAREAAAQLKDEQDADARRTLEKTIEEETLAAQSIVAPQVVPVSTQPATNVVRTGAGASYGRSRWKARLVDLSMVEEKYKVVTVNMTMVQKDVDGGQRTIPGFEVFEERSMSFRG